jgi:starch-binding outer membrane protein, SusD/RagB family
MIITMRSKNIFIGFGLTVALLSACTKQLEIEPKNSVDATTAISTPADVDAAMMGAYATMGGGALYGTDLVMVPELLAQEGYCSWRGTFTGFQQIARKTMNRDNGEAARIWTAAYSAINSANIVLEHLDLVTDEDQKAQLEGEALFVRGIMHFELVRLFALPWGATAANDQPGVVIKTTATTTEEQAFEKTPRNTVAEVYAAVINDLLAAVDKLPDDNGTRADKYTALAFLAKVYLQQSDFENAGMAADAVIRSGKYKMNAAVSAVFDNKNSPESIFEIQQNEQNNAGTSNDGLATFFASLPGIGRADVRMNNGFIATYDDNDIRKSEWFYLGTGARPADPDNGVFNNYSGKWKSFSQNIPIVRIAEMYLIRAEANLRLGGTPIGDTPENDLAQVRNPLRTGLPVIANPTLDDVLQERIHELSFEGFRIHEVRRLQGTFDVYNWNDDILVLPIPQREVDATQGIITQNPGY